MYCSRLLNAGYSTYYYFKKFGAQLEILDMIYFLVDTEGSDDFGNVVHARAQHA